MRWGGEPAKATYGRHTSHTARSRTVLWEGFRLFAGLRCGGQRTYLARGTYAVARRRGGKAGGCGVTTDVNGRTPQEVTVADGDAGVGGVYQGLERMRRTSAAAAGHFTSRCGCRGLFDDETGCTYNLFELLCTGCGRSSVRIRLG